MKLKDEIKKIFVVLVVISLFLIVGCGKKEEPSDVVDDNLENETLTGQYETADIKLLDNLSGKNQEILKEIQGHVTHIDNGGTSPIIVANNKVYFANYGTYQEKVTFPDVPDDILFFDNMEIGENIFYFKDNKISLYSADGNDEVIFENIDFNKDTDFVPEIGLSSYFFIVSKDGATYNIKYYEKNFETNKMELNSKNSLETVQTSDYKELTIKDIVVIPSNKYGYNVYVITDNDDAYWVDNVNNHGDMITSSKTPYLTNVDKIFASSDINSHLTVPIYSKVKDENNLYSIASGTSIVDTSDNFEVVFQIPNNHKTNEIKDIFQVSDYLLFVFENGDIYMTDEIEQEGKDTYEMKKLDDISKLNSEGKIVDMAGSSLLDDNIYLLMDDGKVYYQKLYF